MWVKKSIHELAFERKQRLTKAKYIFAIVFVFTCYWALLDFDGLDEFIKAFKRDPERTGMPFLFPLFVWVVYRSYVNHGGFHWTSDRVCVVCGRTWYRSNDGWGFMFFGRGRPKWYQVNVCNTPDKCDIVGRHEVAWVPDEDRIE